MSLAQRISAPALLLLTGKTQPHLESRVRTSQQADVELRLKHMLLLLDLKHTLAWPMTVKRPGTLFLSPAVTRTL